MRDQTIESGEIAADRPFLGCNARRCGGLNGNVHADLRILLIGDVPL
jgi:hypothetical protein